MKVLNLQCSHQHSFEGWFASEDDFQQQLSRGLVECPMCADKSVQKLPSAPRLNLGGHQSPDTSASTLQSSSPAEHPAGAEGNTATRNMPAVAGMPSGASRAEQAAFLQALRHVVANTEDVGSRFADEARRMHYGEQEARSIRGQTSVREAVELMEEGIDVMPLPLPAAIKETLQ
ncbi:hypothetical protein SAMN05216350_101623 [Polaromonas sp. YR568]|uniref:DUF1178 family protein n=1 Tax=Polaromonas sp. YR568 TaxID=1855301 RepID=UPI0008E3F182|nr:DUF1178 family protein [Polaromonas sp. YR568]SFU37785.1 hypothetical protein SAMN05216350_101623 [Polaromonas sp. YR568]